MLKKILLVLLILSPSAIYLYIASKDDSKASSTTQTPPSETVHNPHQTPDH